MATKTTAKTIVKKIVKKAKPVSSAKAVPATATKKAIKKEFKSEPVIEKSGEMSRSVGRRKSASARVRIYRGNGEITVNGMDFKKYFPFFSWQDSVTAPLKAMAKDKDISVSVKVAGGGKKGQADAVRHGIARAMVDWNQDFKKSLKTLGFLTRDSRVKERKKFGLKKARRAPQWSKR